MRQGPTSLLRAYAVSGNVPAPIMHVRDAALAHLPPAWTWRAIAWASYAAAKPELRVMKRFVPRDRLSVDVGSNLGVHSYFLARWSRGVHAFEPNPRLAGYLERAATRNVRVSAIALSDMAGRATLSVPRLHGVEADPYATIEPRVASLRGSLSTEPVHQLEVQTATLDAFGLADVGFIKIDVEGHEVAVLRGARETLQRERPTLLVELDQRYLEPPLEQVLDEICSLGYEGFFLADRHLRPATTFSVDEHQTQPLADPAAGPFVENFLFRPLGIDP